MIIRLVQPTQPLFVETPDSMEREEWNTKRLRYSLLSNKRFVRENQNRIPLTQSDRADIISIHLVYVAVTDDSAHWRWTIFCIFLSFSDFHYWYTSRQLCSPFFEKSPYLLCLGKKERTKKSITIRIKIFKVHWFLEICRQTADRSLLLALPGQWKW